jgi:flagellar protein FliO/FliZ
VEFGFFTALFKMLFALAVVLGLLVGSVYLLKRFAAPAGGGDEGQPIRILAARSLGPKCNVLVVDILGKIVALGVTGSQISLLADLEDATALERLHPPGRASSSPLPEPLDRYRRLLKSLGSSRKGGVS